MTDTRTPKKILSVDRDGARPDHEMEAEAVPASTRLLDTSDGRKPKGRMVKPAVDGRRSIEQCGEGGELRRRTVHTRASAAFRAPALLDDVGDARWAGDMSRRRPILVTGATGNAGREVIRALERRGIPHRAAVRDPDEVMNGVRFDFEDPKSWACACEGCASLFLLRPPPISDIEATLNPFVDAARRAGVEHVTFLSVAGAESNPMVPHHKVETHLKTGAGAWTILRPGFFAQNLQDAYRRDLQESDRLYVPAGSGAVAFVDLRDVAEVAASIFARPEDHLGAGYTLTGPAAFTFDEVAACLTDALGREIVYRPASVPGYLSHLVRQRDAAWAQAVVQTILHIGLRFGQAERIDPTLARLLGHPARSVADYIADHRDLWRVARD